MTPTTLQDRVIAYKCFELPGQPMYTHTGTSRLISDLFIAVEALTKERDALTLGIDQWRVDYHELRLERDTLAAAAKLALDALEWFVENDDTNIGMPGNEFWEDGLNQGIQTITALRQAGVQ